MLILLRGKPGTGKSTLANVLGRRMRAAVIDKDDIKDVLDARYRDEFVGGMTYDIMLRIADRCLAQGVSVICDSPLAFPDLHQRALAIAARHGMPVRTVRLQCSDLDQWRERIEARKGSDMPQHRIATFEDARLHAPERYHVPDELVVDTSNPIDQTVASILAFCASLQSAAEPETA